MPEKSNNWLLIHDPITGHAEEIPPGYAARLLGVSRSTALRWCRQGIPPIAQRHLAALVHGVLPDPAWQDFRTRGAFLVNLATGERFSAQDLKTAYLAHQQVSALRERLRLIERPPARVLRLASG